MAENRYVPGEVQAGWPEQRIVEAAAHLPPGGALTGWASLRLRGARYLDGSARPVPLVLGPHDGRRQRPGVKFSYDRLEPVSTVRGIPCQSALRSLFDEMRIQRRLVDAVVAVDMTVLPGLVTLAGFDEYVRGHTGWAGVPMVRKALALADPHTASPPEARLRLLWQLVLGLPRPLVNVGVFDDQDCFVGYPDLLDLEAGLVIEYDGVSHAPEKRASNDFDRDGAFRDLGLEVVHVVGGDLRQPTELGRRLMQARRRARFEPADRRAWTVEPAARARYCPRSCSCRAQQLPGP